MEKDLENKQSKNIDFPFILPIKDKTDLLSNSDIRIFRLT